MIVRPRGSSPISSGQAATYQAFLRNGAIVSSLMAAIPPVDSGSSHSQRSARETRREAATLDIQAIVFPPKPISSRAEPGPNHATDGATHESLADRRRRRHRHPRTSRASLARTRARTGEGSSAGELDQLPRPGHGARAGPEGPRLAAHPEFRWGGRGDRSGLRCRRHRKRAIAWRAAFSRTGRRATFRPPRWRAPWAVRSTACWPKRSC